MRLLIFCISALTIFGQLHAQSDPPGAPATYRVWEPITLTFDGPLLKEEPATFLNYRLQVLFTHRETGKNYNVPGFFAADGMAAESSVASGNVWKVHFTPDRSGTWTYAAFFRKGERIAISLEGLAGESAGYFDGASGTLAVGQAKNSQMAKGMLKYAAQHYLQYAGSGDYFIKGGAGSPENLLAYDDFDGTFDNGGTHFPALGEKQLHTYAPHARDWQPGDALWKDSLGTELIGALNYISSKGLNAVYFLTMNVKGDGDDVWPWTGPEERTVFDVSKLEQWEVVFDHMDKKGILKDLLLSETENENLFEALDGEEFAYTRKLYYRELIARFGHHLGLVWNLGEENGHDPNTGERPYNLPNTDAQRRGFSAYIRLLDPYDHPIVVHNWPGDEEVLYGPLLGFGAMEGVSLQEDNNYYEEVLKWRKASSAAGKKWLVCVDEPLGWEFGLRPDAEDPDHDMARQEVLWPTLFAGGMGVDWYFGWQNNAPTSDLSNEDWRSRDSMWEQTRLALDFFHAYLPFEEMTPSPELSPDPGTRVLAKETQLYAVYVKSGAAPRLLLSEPGANYSIQWYNPKFGGELQKGSLDTVMATGRMVSLGRPPAGRQGDWVALLKQQQ